jgi:hypothetical protein
MGFTKQQLLDICLALDLDHVFPRSTVDEITELIKARVKEILREKGKESGKVQLQWATKAIGTVPPSRTSPPATAPGEVRPSTCAAAAEANSDDDGIEITSVKSLKSKKKKQMLKEMMSMLLAATEEDDEEEESVKMKGGGKSRGFGHADAVKMEVRDRPATFNPGERTKVAKERLQKILAKRNAEKHQDEDPKLDEESDVEKFIEKLQQKQIQEDFFATHVKVNFRGGGMKTSREEKGTSSSSAIAAGEEDSYDQKVL